MSVRHVLPLMPLALLVLVLLKVMVDDVTRYLITHRSIGAAALLYFVYLLCGGPSASLPGSVVVAAIALLVGMALFLLGSMGGGDVKLLAVLVLWAGPDEVFPFLVVTSVLGGLLTLFVMSPWWSFIPSGTPRLHVLARSAVPAGAAELLSPEAGLSPVNPSLTLRRKTLAVPYGVAIAAAGVMLAAERAYLVLSVP